MRVSIGRDDLTDLFSVECLVGAYFGRCSEK